MERTNVEWASDLDKVVARLEAADSKLRGCYAANSIRKMRTDWAVWMEFCTRTGATSLPADLPSLEAFLNEGIQPPKPNKLSTLKSRFVTLHLVHQLAGFQWVMDYVPGKRMWQRFSSEVAEQKLRRAQPIGSVELERMLRSLEPIKHPRDARDAALLAVAYDGLLHESDLVNLRFNQLRLKKNGTGRLLLPRNLQGLDNGGDEFLTAETADEVHLTKRTVKLLLRWIELAGLQSGHVFRAVSISNPPTFESPLYARLIGRMYKQVGKRAGMDSENFSAMSTRIGAARDLIAAGHDTRDVARYGRWKSSLMLFEYASDLLFTDDPAQSAMAQFLEGRERN